MANGVEKPFPLNPPATSAFPVKSSAEACSYLGVAMLPVEAKVSVTGSYSSAEARALLGPFIAKPPVIRTFPLGRRTA